MKQPSTHALSVFAVFLFSLTLAACSTAPHRHEPLDQFDLKTRAVTQEQNGIRISASVPSVEEATKVFGIPVYDRGIQPVWLEVTNLGTARARLVLSSIDPEYFSPMEVAYMHRKRFSKQGWMDLENHLYANALPRQIWPGETVSGFIFTHASNGTKAFNVDLFSTGDEPEYLQFTFFIEVPGFVPDHKQVDFESLYTAADIRHVDADGLRVLLEDIPCCTSNHDGTQPGRPLQLFFIAPGRDLLRALLRADWDETSYARDSSYLTAADYLYGRPPDAVFRKRRDKSTERAELGLWLAPILVDGKPLWVGQFKHAIGRRYAIGEMFLGVTLDPDTNDGRNFVLQDLWYAQFLQHWGWSKTGHQVPQEMPEQDFHGNPWFANDAYRVAIWVSEKPIAVADATRIDWGRHEMMTGKQP